MHINAWIVYLFAIDIETAFCSQHCCSDIIGNWCQIYIRYTKQNNIGKHPTILGKHADFGFTI
jgi:hypothetical protein